MLFPLPSVLPEHTVFTFSWPGRSRTTEIHPAEIGLFEIGLVEISLVEIRLAEED